MFLDALEAGNPLRWRELYLDNDVPFPTGVYIKVCDEGHVHLLHGGMMPIMAETLHGILAWTLARILDTKREIPKRPGQAVIERVIGETHRTLANIDEGFSVAYLHHLDILKGWLQSYVTQASGKPLWPGAPDGPATVYVESAIPREEPEPQRAAQRRRRPSARVSVEIPDEFEVGVQLPTLFTDGHFIGIFTGEVIEPGQA